MKFYLCDNIEHASISSVLKIENGIVTFFNTSQGFTSIDELASAQLTEESKITDSGQLITQKMELKCQMDIDRFNTINEQPCIMRVRFSDGSVHIWGDKTRPVIIMSCKRENLQAQLTFQRQNTAFDF